MVYQQESEILQSHAMTLLTEYTSLYLSNIIYSSYTSISDRANEHVVYTSQGESNEPWVGSMGKVNEGDVKQKLVYLVVVDGGWGRGGGGYPDGMILFEDIISLGQNNQILFVESRLLWSFNYCQLLVSVCPF